MKRLYSVTIPVLVEADSAAEAFNAVCEDFDERDITYDNRFLTPSDNVEVA